MAMEHKGYERLVNFTDAVVAIAATLLILPVVDAATQLGERNVDNFLRSVIPEFLMFLLSFVLIANFWLEHHRLFRRIDKFDATLMYTNFVWLIGIVVMPVPTALVVNGDGHDRISMAFYIGTMLVISSMQFIMNYHVHKHPELEHGQAHNVNRVLGAFLSALYLAIALLIAVIFPGIGLWSLMVMFLIPVSVLVIRRMQNRK